MNENLKLIAKIGAKSTLKWIGVLALGTLITITFFIIAWFQNKELSKLIFINPAAFVLIVGSPLFLLFYFFIANKITIQNLIYSIWTNKAVDFVDPLVEKIGAKITSKKQWTKEISNQNILKAKLISENAAATETPNMQRKIMNYAIKKVKLDDINLKDENLMLSDILSLKIKSFVSTVAKPSFTLFWGLAIFQLILLVISQFFRS